MVNGIGATVWRWPFESSNRWPTNYGFEWKNPRHTNQYHPTLLIMQWVHIMPAWWLVCLAHSQLVLFLGWSALIHPNLTLLYPTWVKTRESENTYNSSQTTIHTSTTRQEEREGGGGMEVDYNKPKKWVEPMIQQIPPVRRPVVAFSPSFIEHSIYPNICALNILQVI